MDDAVRLVKLPLKFLGRASRLGFGAFSLDAELLGGLGFGDRVGRLVERRAGDERGARDQQENSS